MAQNEDKFEPRKDVIIEGHVAKFRLSILGAIAGTYAGEFTFRCFLTPSQKIAANRDYRAMLGDNPTLAPEHESFLAYALSQLKYRIIDAPPFWTSTQQVNGVSGDLADEEVITAVLDAAIHAELKYKHELQKEKLALLERAKAAAERILKGQDDEDEDLEDEYDEESEESSD